MTNINTLRKTAYNLYQLDWMMSHGFSLTDAFASITEYILEYAEGYSTVASALENLETALNDPSETVLNWACDTGFNEECFAPYFEFLENEYQDETYMKTLFQSNANMKNKFSDIWALYTKDVTNN